MTRDLLRRYSFAGSIVFSLIGLALVLVNLAAGVAPQPDEGAAAHLYQLVVPLALVLAALYAIVADWRRPAQVIGRLALLALALASALAALWLSGY